MREKAALIYQKLLNDKPAISDIDVHNQDISKIIKTIANECKSTVTTSTGEVKNYESVLRKDDVEELIIQFFKNSRKISSTVIRDVMTTYYEPHEYKARHQNETKILGPALDTFLEKKLSQDGKEIEKIEIKSPIANDIIECIAGKDEKQRDEIRRLVLEPYVDNLISDNDELSIKHPIRSFFNKILGRQKDTNKIIQDYTEILSEDLDLEIAKNTATYIVENLFMNEAFSKDLAEKARTGNLIEIIDDKSKGYNGFKNQMVSEIFDSINSQKINPVEGIETINQVYSDMLAQLKVMRTTIENKDPKGIEEDLKKINRIILPDSKDYEENGYRSREVQMGSKGGAIKVVPKEHVGKAMEHLTSYIEHVINNKNNMSEKEYIKEVSRVHYRFIRIHPFPDGNGRTGRALINMMLAPIGESIVFDKEEKHKYMDYLGFKHRNINYIDGDKYLENLYENPEECIEFEEESSRALEEFLGEKLELDYSDSLDKQITEEIDDVIDKVKEKLDEQEKTDKKGFER